MSDEGGSGVKCQTLAGFHGLDAWLPAAQNPCKSEFWAISSPFDLKLRPEFKSFVALTLELLCEWKTVRVPSRIDSGEEVLCILCVIWTGATAGTRTRMNFPLIVVNGEFFWWNLAWNKPLGAIEMDKFAFRIASKSSPEPCEGPGRTKVVSFHPLKRFAEHWASLERGKSPHSRPESLASAKFASKLAWKSCEGLE